MADPAKGRSWKPYPLVICIIINPNYDFTTLLLLFQTHMKVATTYRGNNFLNRKRNTQPVGGLFPIRGSKSL